MARRKADKPLVWLHGEVKTPPFSKEGRIEAGTLLRRLQTGEKLTLPHSRPMPVVGSRCHELRIQDQDVTWRIMGRVDSDAVIIAGVFAKQTSASPRTGTSAAPEPIRSRSRSSRCCGWRWDSWRHACRRAARHGSIRVPRCARNGGQASARFRFSMASSTSAGLL